MTAATIPAIVERLTVRATPADAFAAFTEGLDSWWPRESTWSGSGAQRVALEPRPGGFLHEIGPHGMRLDWGRISVWEPPHRLAFSWQVGPDRVPVPSPAEASQVEVRFEAEAADRTRVTVTHDGWERHGEAGAAYREQMASTGAWAQMLERYAAVVAPRAEAPWSGLTT
ncbi:MAG TPA: SRPBCC family protein [candidate division Zixibacteria bacterium]|nr:SRPBCC family protein [candidate division Zixibacteria bacterium]